MSIIFLKEKEQKSSSPNIEKIELNNIDRYSKNFKNNLKKNYKKINTILRMA